MAVPLVVLVTELVAKPHTLRVRFSDDLPSSSGVSYQDIGLDEVLTQRELEQKRHKYRDNPAEQQTMALQVATQGLEVSHVVAVGHEDDEDPEEDSEENSVDTKNFSTHEDSS
ncbi:hypothetical protein FNV43_RR24650 [Rhamnella rubrinervis]|uniref:Uncharacterized protein n=1 Tax=Rhamnella rubrinervis TaxID=2594499 RepID=A0A8K0DSU0_9ROSA|nr:hypothetical protein FNV43_RR24650 [Rhamnella rubrinervis]